MTFVAPFDHHKIHDSHIDLFSLHMSAMVSYSSFVNALYIISIISLYLVLV